MTERDYWKRYLSAASKRLFKSGTDGDRIRSAFQRDYDRIVFSEAFRRLQNKTQVLPFPDDESVRNRLTHSIETASVGRSLGFMAGQYLTAKYPRLMQELQLDPYDFAYMVSAAALAHDIGNPPFGHQGETAIGEFFEGDFPGKDHLSAGQLLDLQHFEGNAAGFRILANTVYRQAQIRGGLRLSLGTYGAFVKYPKSSEPVPHHGPKNTKPVSLKKFGYFRAEADTFRHIAGQLQLLTHEGAAGAWKRFPLAFLTEAADDICYTVIDFEDAYHLGWISYELIFERFDDLIRPQLSGPALQGYRNYLEAIRDPHQRIGYMRSQAINLLVRGTVEAFRQHETGILDGSFDRPLTEHLPPDMQPVFDRIQNLSRERIYNHPSVLRKEAAGRTVIPFLLERFVSALFQPRKYKQYYLLMPPLYRQEHDGPYEKLLQAAMFVSSMSDKQAMRWYRNFRGIDWMD